MKKLASRKIKSFFGFLYQLADTKKNPVKHAAPVNKNMRCRRSIGRCEANAALAGAAALSSSDLIQKAAANIEKEVIQDVSGLPGYTKNLIAPREFLADVGEKFRHKFALLEVGEKKCVVVALPTAMASGVLATTIARAKEAGYQITGKRHVTFKVLDEINTIHGNDKTAAEIVEEKELSAADQNRLLFLFDEIVSDAIKKNASDIHICIRKEDCGMTGAVLFRIDGRLEKEYSHDGLALMDMLSVAYNSTRITTPDSRSHTVFNARMPQSCTMEYSANGSTTRFRYHDTDCKDGMDAVMRVLSDEKNSRIGGSLKDLGFEESQRRDLEMASLMPDGVIIVAGATGSGKSTTLKTLIDYLRKRNPHKKYYTIEDPAEFKLWGVTQISISRAEEDKDGNSANPFALATERLMRMDPDVVMSGEIRDFQSGSATKQLVQTGHQVFTTVHAKNAFQIPSRLSSTEIGMNRETISSEGFMVALISQKLVPKLCPKCKVPGSTVLTPEKLRYIEQQYGIDPVVIKCRPPKGCDSCGKRGSVGRTVCAEVILPSREMLVLFREGKDDEAENLYRSKQCAPYTHPDMTGKVAFEHALYKISQGLVDPRDVENVFGPFELLDTKKTIKGIEYEYGISGEQVSAFINQADGEPRPN